MKPISFVQRTRRLTGLLPTRQTLICLILFCAVMNSLPAAAMPPIKTFTATFDLLRDDDKVGESVIRLHPTGDGGWLFETRSNARLFFFSFSDREQSRLRWHDGWPQPLAFEKERHRPGKTEIVRQQFDWQSRIDSGERGKKKWSKPLQPGTQDLQSHLLALQLDLQAGKREMQYTVSRYGSLRNFRYQVVKEEQINTALGQLHTLRVERVRDADDDRQTISWFAPSLGYIAVRTMQYEDGELQGDMQIRTLVR